MECGHPCLVSDFSGKAFAFSKYSIFVEYYIGCGFVINSFYYVEICSLWASLVAQLVKNLPAMQETRV